MDKSKEKTQPDLFGLLFYKTVRLHSETMIDPEKFLLELKRKQENERSKPTR